jgi:PIN domain
MQLFIDTNIFLSLYHFTADDLEELEKLRVLLKQSKITLLLPRQVMHEFARNRDHKVAEAIRQLREQKLRAEFPQLCKDYAEYSALRSLQQQFETLHSTLCETIATDAIDRKLRADSTIDGLFAAASPIEEGPEILQSARDRMDRGTPPGKRDSLGDAINWVSLLEAATDGDLHVVTGDKDFVSPLDESSMNSFLIDEWRDQKVGDIHFFRYLSRFFSDHFPDIKLTSELAKEDLLSRLIRSPSFASTHPLGYNGVHD